MIPNSERTNAAVAFVDGAPMLLCCFDFGTIPLRIGVGSCCEGGCIVTEIWGVYITLGAQNQSAYAQILSNTNFEHKGALVNDVIFVGSVVVVCIHKGPPCRYFCYSGVKFMFVFANHQA